MKSRPFRFGILVGKRPIVGIFGGMTIFQRSILKEIN